MLDGGQSRLLRGGDDGIDVRNFQRHVVEAGALIGHKLGEKRVLDFGSDEFQS